MKLIAKILFFIVVFTILGTVPFISACNYSKKDIQMKLPDDLSKITTHCIGRYLIDLPSVFELSPGSYAQFYYGLGKDFETIELELPNQNSSSQNFDEVVRQRIVSLSSDYHFHSPSKNMLAFERRVDDRVRIVRGYDDPRSINTFKSQIFAYKGPVIALFSRDVYSSDLPESIEAMLLQVVQDSRYAKSYVDANIGSCLGSLVVNAKQDGEIIHPAFFSSKYPDIHVSIDMNSLVAKGDGGLFARLNAKSEMLAKLAYSSDTIRKDKTSMGGRVAEEILESGKDHGKVVRSFTSETLLPTPSTFAIPLISIDMSMGGQVGSNYQDASFTQDEAVALWDSIIKSIRLRPGAL